MLISMVSHWNEYDVDLLRGDYSLKPILVCITFDGDDDDSRLDLWRASLGSWIIVWRVFFSISCTSGWGLFRKRSSFGSWFLVLVSREVPGTFPYWTGSCEVRSNSSCFKIAANSLFNGSSDLLGDFFGHSTLGFLTNLSDAFLINSGISSLAWNIVSGILLFIIPAYCSQFSLFVSQRCQKHRSTALKTELLLSTFIIEKKNL